MSERSHLGGGPLDAGLGRAIHQIDYGANAHPGRSAGCHGTGKHVNALALRGRHGHIVLRNDVGATADPRRDQPVHTVHRHRTGGTDR